MSEACQLTVAPLFQCCCNCVYRLPVHFSCDHDPQPTTEQVKAASVELNAQGRCVCGIQKGWACVAPEMGRVYDNWPEHSCGCELYTPKEKPKAVEEILATACPWCDEGVKAHRYYLCPNHEQERKALAEAR